MNEWKENKNMKENERTKKWLINWLILGVRTINSHQ